MEIEDSLCKMSPNNPFLDKFSVDFIEESDNETVINFDYKEEDFDHMNHIEKVCAEDSEHESNETEEENNDNEDNVVTNGCDNLLMGSQLMSDKYLKEKEKSNDIHKKCRLDKINERNIRIELKMELELERQQRIQFQKQLEEHMSYSLRKEFNDSKQIKELKLELLKCKQELQTLKKSFESHNNSNDFDLNSNELLKPNEEMMSCSDCESVMKSEVSMILHLINHCIEEEEFQLETQIFRLDEFTDSMIDSIRKSVSYCCPRCYISFDCLEIYYHIYKCHTKEIPIICSPCKVYCTHIEYWAQHNQSLHNGSVNMISYSNIGETQRSRDQLSDSKSHPNGSKSSVNSKSYPKRKRNNYYNLSTSQQLRSHQINENKSDKSDSPEVINLTDSPPHISSAPVMYRPITSKPTLALRSVEYECDFPDCDFKTTSKDKLEFHTSAHTNSKFKCPYCPYVGNILNDIIRHIQKSKKHDGLKVYECRQCSYGSNCLSSFKEHLTHRHFDSDEEDIDEYIADMFRNEHSTNDDKKD